MKKVTTGKDALSDFAPKFAELNDDVLFGWQKKFIRIKEEKSC